jgi:hypothetical protein
MMAPMVVPNAKAEEMAATQAKTEEMAVTKAKAEEMAATQAKTEAMAVTPNDDDDDDWDDSTVIAGPIGGYVAPPVPVEPQHRVLPNPAKPKVEVAKPPKNDDKKVLRQKWATFVKAICWNRPKHFIVKADDANSPAWAVKTLTTSEYFFWMKGYRLYKHNAFLELPQKRGIKAAIDHKKARELNDLFVTLFKQNGFWLTHKEQNEYEWEEYFRNFSE